MWIYLEGDAVKGVVPSHTIAVNPGNHLGINNVPAAWCERDTAGNLVGRTFYIHFINGKADTEFDGVGEYMVRHGMARRERWDPPPGSVSEAVDPWWRWREGAPE